jgi:uncharacterized membrane protein (UPF0127 family)
MRIIFCDKFFSRLRGLMFTRRADRALVLRFAGEKYVSLHMFFVFYPVDVVYLDSEKRIVELKPGFRPFSLYFPGHKARYILELPAGYIQAHALAVGNPFTCFEI